MHVNVPCICTLSFLLRSWAKQWPWHISGHDCSGPHLHWSLWAVAKVTLLCPTGTLSLSGMDCCPLPSQTFPCHTWSNVTLSAHSWWGTIWYHCHNASICAPTFPLTCETWSSALFCVHVNWIQRNWRPSGLQQVQPRAEIGPHPCHPSGPDPPNKINK